MRHLRTAITSSVALGLFPLVTCRAVYRKGSGAARILNGRESFDSQLFIHRDGYPGSTFEEDTEVHYEWQTRGDRWQEIPRDTDGGGGESAEQWVWVDGQAPCIPADEYWSKKGSKKTGPPKSTKAPKKSKAKSKYIICPTPSPVVSAGTPAPDDGAVGGGAAPTFRPSGAGGPTDIDITDPGATSDTCKAIASGDKPMDRSGTELKEYSVQLTISYVRRTGETPWTRDGVKGKLEAIRFILACWVGGCEALAIQLANEYAASLRRLASGEVEFVEFQYSDYPEGVNPVCTQDQTFSPCPEVFRMLVDVYYYQISGAETLFKERIKEAFNVFAYLLNPAGLSFDPGTGVSVDTKDDDTDSAERGPPPVEDSVNVAAVIGASAGGLAFILLIVLLVRRKQAEDEVSHSKLEEDADETFIRELETTASSPSRDGNYETRNVHVVGEADSIFSGWTGYTQHERAEDEHRMYERGDVHKCSSATCEVCEMRRQGGIQFIPTGSPAILHIPTNASREYVADDTVEL